MVLEKTNLMHKQCGSFLWSSLLRLFVVLKMHVTNCYGAVLLCNWGFRGLTPSSTSLTVVCGFPYSLQTNYIIVTAFYILLFSIVVQEASCCLQHIILLVYGYYLVTCVCARTHTCAQAACSWTGVQEVWG